MVTRQGRYRVVSGFLLLVMLLSMFSVIAVSNKTGKCLRADMNGDGKVNISDVVYLINYLFKHGPAPVECAENKVTLNNASIFVSDFVKRVFCVELSYINGEESGEVFKLTYSYSNREIVFETTKDLAFIMFPDSNWIRVKDYEGFVLNCSDEENEANQTDSSDKPRVELFVMSYCPYGTQAEKGILPVVELLGNKADIKVRFVHYFMHGEKEEEETYRQLCMREEHEDDYWKYLKCFLKDGDSQRCLAEVSLDEKDINNCIESDAKDYYEDDAKLSNKYGVQGSPTLVITGKQVEFYPRSPAEALRIVCDAFDEKPEECDTKLSEENPSPGFGYSLSGTSTINSCG